MYCLHLYGGMLWNFSSDQTGQFCRSWNTSVKLAHNVPRGTKTFLVDNFLADSFPPVIQELYARYVKFLKALRTSPSQEIKHLFNMVKTDVQSNTGLNINMIQRDTSLDPCKVNSSQVRSVKMKTEVPENDVWRIPLLKKLLEQRSDLEHQMSNTEELTTLISGVCCT